MYNIKTDIQPFDFKRIYDESLIKIGMNIPRSKTLLTISDGRVKNVLTAGNLSVIQGAEKSRKTFFIMLLCSILIKGEDWMFNSNVDNIVIFDTEQYKWHTLRFLTRLSNMVSSVENIKIMNLRALKKAERVDFIEEYIRLYKPCIAFIDNIRDLIGNFNDVDQSDEIITLLSNLSEQNGTHICNTIHLAKTTGQARGHVGAELMQKAETVLEIKTDEDTDITTVMRKFSRDEKFDDFSFKLVDGLPELVSGFKIVEPKQENIFD